MANFLNDSEAPAPKAEPKPKGMVQNDGNISAIPVKPTKVGTIQGSASPAKYATSGMERAMGELADKTHPKRSR